MAGTKGIVSNQFYTFSAANKTITFSSDYAGLDLGEIAYITNIKNGIATVIYDPFDATKGGTLNGLTLTLAYDTTTMQDTDPLQVIVGFTPLNADPLPVKIVEGADQLDDTAILQNISDNLDFLNLALDQTEGIQMNTRDVSIKKDIQGAIVPSDCIEIQGPPLRGPNDTFVVDTTGYNTAIFNIPATNVLNATLTVDASNDGNNWYGIPFNTATQNFAMSFTTATSGTTLSANNAYTILTQSPSKFVRIRLSGYASGVIRPSVTLRNWIPNSVGVLTNITQFAGTAPVASTAGSATTTTGGSTTTGTISVGPAYVPTHNPPNAATTLATNVPYPFGIAGREQPYIGALSGIFRYLTVDGGGRYILGGDTPDTETRFQSKLASGAIPGIPPRGVGAISNNIIGAQSLTVVDTQQSEGDNNTMLLKQILQELKILNQQLTEIPFLMNAGQSQMSDPQEYRNDNSTLF